MFLNAIYYMNETEDFYLIDVLFFWLVFVAASIPFG